MSATRREDNNRIQEKDDQEMEATVFNSQETPSGLRFGNWKQRKVTVRWHLGNFPRHYRYLRRIGLEVLMIELKLLTGCDISMKTTTRICAAIAGIAAIDERKYSERSIT